MGIIEYFGLRPLQRRDPGPLGVVMQDVQGGADLDAADLQQLATARRSLESAAVTADHRRALALLTNASVELQGIVRQNHAQVAELRQEIEVERNQRLLERGDEVDTDDESSSSSSSDDEDWDERWDIIVPADNPRGWDKKRVAVADLKDPLWIQTGHQDFQHAYLEQLDLTSSEPWMLSGTPFVWALAQDAQAIQNLIKHPEPKETSASDGESSGFVAMEAEELHPERKDEGELVNYPGDKLPTGLDLPLPYREKGDGESVQHAYKKVTGTLYGKEEMKPTDVVQGLGNCYFMGSIAALTTTPSGREALKRRVGRVKGAEPDGDGNVTAWLPVMSKKDGGEILVCAGRGASTDAPPPLWIALLEQQHAREAGGYKNVEGGTAETAFGHLGIESETLEVLRMPAKELREWFLARGDCPIVMGTPMSYGKKPSGGAAERVPFRALPFLYCEDLQASMPKRLQVRPDATGAIEFDGKTVAHLLDKDGKAPAEDPRWISEPLVFVSQALAERLRISCMPHFENPKKLSAAHLYTVAKVQDDGVDVWDQLSRKSLFLSYAEISASIRTVSVAKL